MKSRLLFGRGDLLVEALALDLRDPAATRTRLEMSCSSLPVATAPYLVRTPSSLTDLMFGVGQERGRVLRALVEHGAPGGDQVAELVLLRFGGGEAPLALRRPRPARSGTRAPRRCTARPARRSCRRWPGSRASSCAAWPSCRRSSSRSRATALSAPSSITAVTTTNGYADGAVIARADDIAVDGLTDATCERSETAGGRPVRASTKLSGVSTVGSGYALVYGACQ